VEPYTQLTYGVYYDTLRGILWAIPRPAGEPAGGSDTYTDI
jgi:hypothetical protein